MFVNIVNRKQAYTFIYNLMTSYSQSIIFFISSIIAIVIFIIDQKNTNVDGRCTICIYQKDLNIDKNCVCCIESF